MTTVPTRLLLIEDNAGDARLAQAALADHAPGEFAVTWVERLADALSRIAKKSFDAALCDLGLPDSTGLGTAQALIGAAPALPLVVFTGSHNEDLGRAAIQHGAQDYLVKGEAGGEMIARALRYAIARKRLEIELRAANEALERRVAERTAELEMANQSLGEGEARYRQLFEANPHPMWVFDLETLAFLAVNDAAVAHYGWSREEFIAMTLAEIRPAETIPVLLKYLASDNEKGIRTVDSSKHRKKDGTLIDVEISSHAVDFGGRRARIASAYDITERKCAQEKLRASEERLRLHVEQTPLGVIEWDEGFRVVNWNLAAERIFGYTPVEAQGRHASFILPASAKELVDQVWSGLLSGQGGERSTNENITKDGRTIICEWYNTRLTRSDNNSFGVASLVNDITERKRVEETARANENRLRVALSNINMAVFHQDRALRYTWMYQPQLGYLPEQVIGHTDAELLPPEAARRITELKQRVLETGEIVHDEVGVSVKDATFFFDLTAEPFRDLGGAIVGLTGVTLDITERKRAEESLRESEQELRAIFDGALDGILVADVDTRKVVAANAAICGMLGYTHEEIIGISVPDIHPKQDMPRMMEQFERQLRSEIQVATNAPMIRKDGTVFYADIKAAPIRFGGTEAMLGMFRDTTERKLAEEALARESKRNQVFLRNASDGVHILDADGNVLEVSDSFCKMLGYTREELIGANVSLWDARWSPQELTQLIAEQIAKEGHSILETRHRRRDGRLLEVEVTGQGLELDGKPVLFNSARDITERIRDARELVESEARFRGLVEQSIAGIYIIQDGKFAYVNPRFAEIFGYDSADEMIGREPSSVVAEKDRGIVAENIRRRIEGEVANVAYDFTALRMDGSFIEVGVQGSGATYRGRPAVIGLLQDISQKKRAQEEIERYIAQLRTAFMSTVEVATIISELRDPYTTGHERRVAAIAVAIGAELGLDADRQEGLRVAGHLHDIGKISTPAEILSKPGKLSAIEFELIKGHAQAGYDVLKGVEFPWPVAQVALQHHERMDGSGYPQGLKGEAILFEARIMAVADVVEAMSSHRPYRPGLGIDKALAEIEGGRGSAYDPAVADACLRLFRERCYQLPA